MKYNINKEYWVDRYGRMEAERVVGNVSWNADKYKKENDEWESKIRPFLDKIKIDGQSSLLDFGCGIGRWIPMLGEYCTHYYGTDIMESAIDRAMKVKSKNEFSFFGEIEDEKIPNIAPKYNTIYTCVVLQHVVDDNVLREYVKQFYDLLDDDGHALIVENVSKNKDKNYIKFRDKEFYITLFEKTGFKLVEKESFISTSEEHCIMLFKKEK